MRLTAAMKAALRNRRTPKIILLTVVFSEDDLFTEPHPAIRPRAVRAATLGCAPVETNTGHAYPFYSTIREWPGLRREWSPAERRAPVANTRVSLTHAADFPHDAVGPGSPPPVWARIDLWCPGVPLNEALPVMAGPVTAAPYEDRRAGVSLSIEDGDTLRAVNFPPGQGTISIGDFPDAPDLVLGHARRQTIFGPFPDPIPCIPISRDGTRWYLMEPAAFVPPTAFQIGGVEVASGDRPQVNVGRFASDPTRTFTELVFPQASTNLGLFGAVTASGGVGLAVDSAPITLLRDIGGYRLSPRAERDLLVAAQRFNFSVFQNQSGPVLDIVRDRILPQTDLVLTMHLNQIDTLRLKARGVRRRMSLGHGLWKYDPTTHQTSSSDTVWNAIEVKFRRNVLILTPSGSLTRDVLVVSKGYGGPIGSLLARSEKRYGRRLLEIEAADLVDDGTGGIPASVTELGELTAVLNAFPHRPAMYHAPWAEGLGLELNDEIELTDPDQAFDATPVRVAMTEILPTGPRIGFVTEDAE